ncbi:hypothetical protein SAMN05421868_12624 [Paenibacillus naphthalenovorans]|nr:hypothetical protein SAMN05421868_12624 [Paenibacillus naphthalenovorans]
MTAKFFVWKSVEARKEAGAGKVAYEIDEARLACLEANTGLLNNTNRDSR